MGVGHWALGSRRLAITSSTPSISSTPSTLHSKIMLNKITSPTLVINEDICRANIRRMAEKANASDVIFRPHFKTHQSLQVADWFRDQGVDRITVSSAEMAIKFAKAGWENITIAFPANIREIDTYNGLAEKLKLNLLTDSIEATEALVSKLNTETGIFIEIDTGYGRSGVHYSNEDMVREIIHLIDHALKLSFKGFLTHSGNTYSATNTGQIKDIYNNTIAKLHSLKDKYLNTHPDIIISIGDTPSCSLVDDLSGADELRPGNFVYYDLMQHYLGSCNLSDIAVSVACPVTGIYPDRNEIVIYGGAVHLSKEFLDQDGRFFGLVVQYNENVWSIPVPETRLISISQEHGIISTSREFLKTLKHGDLLGILPVHSCLTANLLKDKMITV